MYKTQFAQQEDENNFLLTKQNLKPAFTLYFSLLVLSAVCAFLLPGILTIGLLGHASFGLHIVALVLYWVKYNKFGTPFIFWLAVWTSAITFYDWHPFFILNTVVTNLFYIAVLGAAVAFSMQKQRKLKEGFKSQKKIFEFWATAVLFYGTSLLMAFGFWKISFFGYLYTASIFIASIFLLLTALKINDSDKA